MSWLGMTVKEKSNLLRVRTQRSLLSQTMPGMLDEKECVKPEWQWLFDGLENEPGKVFDLNAMCLMTNISPEWANGLTGKITFCGTLEQNSLD